MSSTRSTALRILAASALVVATVVVLASIKPTFKYVMRGVAFTVMALLAWACWRASRRAEADARATRRARARERRASRVPGGGIADEES